MSHTSAPGRNLSLSLSDSEADSEADSHARSSLGSSLGSPDPAADRQLGSRLRSRLGIRCRLASGCLRQVPPLPVVSCPLSLLLVPVSPSLSLLSFPLPLPLPPSPIPSTSLSLSLPSLSRSSFCPASLPPSLPPSFHSVLARKPGVSLAPLCPRLIRAYPAGACSSAHRPSSRSLVDTSLETCGSDTGISCPASRLMCPIPAFRHSHQWQPCHRLDRHTFFCPQLGFANLMALMRAHNRSWALSDLRSSADLRCAPLAAKVQASAPLP